MIPDVQTDHWYRLTTGTDWRDGQVWSVVHDTVGCNSVTWRPWWIRSSASTPFTALASRGDMFLPLSLPPLPSFSLPSPSLSLSLRHDRTVRTDMGLRGRSAFTQTECQERGAAGMLLLPWLLSYLIMVTMWRMVEIRVAWGRGVRPWNKGLVGTCLCQLQDGVWWTVWVMKTNSPKHRINMHQWWLSLWCVVPGSDALWFGVVLCSWLCSAAINSVGL